MATVKIKSRSVWPWSFLWRNTKSYYFFYKEPIGELSNSKAEAAVKKISANSKKLEKLGLIVRKYAAEKGNKSSEFKI